MNIFSFLFKRKKLQNILNYYPEAILIVSMTGEILFANEHLLNLFNINGSELSELELYDIFDGGFNLVKELTKSNDSMIVRSKLNSENELFLEIKSSEYDDGEEKIIITIRNVTNNHKMLNQLMFEHEYMNKLTKNKNTFLSKIAGELTSPIHSINGFSQAILEGLGGEVNIKQEKYLKIINKNSTQLLELVNSLVEYSKLESGLCGYELKNFDFVNLMTALFTEFKPLADEKKLVLNFDLNSLSRRTLYTDENLLKRIVSGLIEHSISTTDSGSVQVVVSHPDNDFLEVIGMPVPENVPEKAYLRIQIIDTGAGLSEADAENIFDPYVNIEKYITKKAVNKSLSLGIIAHLVKLLKGKIWVESESMKGSCYSFIIPVEKFTI